MCTDSKNENILINKKVVLSLIVLSIIVFILGLHGGSEYYFRDFCIHKALNMFYNNGSPEFFKKPGLISDIYAFVYYIYYLVLHHLHIVQNLDEFVRYFSLGSIPTPKGALSYTFPALIVNNIFAALGVCFTFLTTYILTDKKLIPSFIAGFVLATSYGWMEFSHHLTVDVPLAALCIAVIFFTMYFVRNNSSYSYKQIILLGVLCGLSASAKYNGLLVIVAPVYTLLVSEKSKRSAFFKLLLLLQSTMFAFAVTNPYIFLKFSDFYRDLMYESNHAFIQGHRGSDSENAFLFHLFHSFPNFLGLVSYILSIFGFEVFFQNVKCHYRIKYPIIIFFVFFFVLLCCSPLVFLRYVLPLMPVLAVFVGIFSDFLLKQYSFSKVRKFSIYGLIGIYMLMNLHNAYSYYKLSGYKDIRDSVREVFKSLKLDKHANIFYVDMFNNPYYQEDFLNQFPDIKNNIPLYLYSANNASNQLTSYLSPFLFRNYSITICDSLAFDKLLYIRKDNDYASLDHQYMFYSPVQMAALNQKSSLCPL